MALRVRTNVQSLTAQRNLGLSNQKVAKHMSRLASGYRINKAADDAAGLAISESIRGDIRSLVQARRNANDAESMLQVAEGSLEEINNIIIRLKELSVQSASDTVGGVERNYLNREFQALKHEIDRIAISTDFNGTRLLAGATELDPVLKQLHNESPLEMQVGKDYMLPPDSLDAPNPVNIIRINFNDLNATVEGEGSLGLGSPENESGTRIDSKVDSQLSMMKIESELEKVASYRATIGAVQNRLGSTDRNLGIQIENLATAKSRIKDADFALETAEYTAGNILMQAGAAVLTQANQMPQVVLKLLQ